jgi:hypothetical protein
MFYKSPAFHLFVAAMWQLFPLVDVGIGVEAIMSACIPADGVFGVLAHRLHCLCIWFHLSFITAGELDS